MEGGVQRTDIKKSLWGEEQARQSRYVSEANHRRVHGRGWNYEAQLFLNLYLLNCLLRVKVLELQGRNKTIVSQKTVLRIKRNLIFTEHTKKCAP